MTLSVVAFVWVALAMPIAAAPSAVTLALTLQAPAAHAVAEPTLGSLEDPTLETVEAALLARQDADGGWGLQEPRRERTEQSAARLRVDRDLATRFALAALRLGAQSSASQLAQQRARAWLTRRSEGPARSELAPQKADEAGGTRAAKAPPAARLAPRSRAAPLQARPVVQLARLRAAIESFESDPGRLSEEALLVAIEDSYRGRHDAERAAAHVPAWRVDFGLAELELTERLSRAVELLPPAHASRYQLRLIDEARAALGDDGLVRDPLRARAVSSVGTARALLVLRRVRARAG